MNKFDMMSKDALSRVEEIMNATKLNEFLHRKEEEEKQKNCILWILAIIGIVAELQRLHTAYIVSLLQIIWKISRTTSMMISTTISSRMRATRKKRKTDCDNLVNESE